MKITLLILSLICISMTSYAQTFTGAPSLVWNILDFPIDAGLGLLVGAGVAYGANKIRDKRNKSYQEKNLKK